jgi:ATP-dependent Clp protease ATP-binding subunit ClpA
VFERFNDRGRMVVVLAQQEARTLRHNYIGTEHLLLGLLREGGAAAPVFERFDVTLEEVQAQVARIIGQGDEVVTGQIPFTPRAKKVLELSLSEALKEGDNYIGPGHILLGLVAEGEGVAARILLDFAPLEDIRLAVPDAHDEREFKSESPSAYRRSMGTYHPASRFSRFPKGSASYGGPTLFSRLLAGWLLFAVAFGVGVLIGSAIWG